MINNLPLRAVPRAELEINGMRLIEDTAGELVALVSYDEDAEDIVKAVNACAAAPTAAPFALPLRPARSWETWISLEDFDEEDRADKLAQPITHLLAADGVAVVAAHDLFQFKLSHAEYLAAAANAYPALLELRDAVGALIKAKGRFHTEQNYQALVAAFDRVKP